MQLAIDTSTGYASLALVHGYQIIAELTWQCGSNHSVELSPRLIHLLGQNKVEVSAIDSIVVAKGPGSFNGLRVGVSEAKGLAYSLGIPIVGISTLEATAYQFASTGLQLCAVQNAGREEIAAAIYQRKPRKGWCRLMEEQITTPEILAKVIKVQTLFCGEFDQATTLKIKKLCGSKGLMPNSSDKLRRAGYLAELGQIRIAARDFDDLATLQPLYLRRPPITERKKPF
jgi:tRNA threonylcarbamoyl adenosine modification protein YeaZ